jgi:cobalt/nickel transport system permease protein
MHVPDGYVSPQTCVVSFAAAVPLWAVASRRVTQVVKTKDVPLLAMFSAFTFLVMMFNIPIPDGTSAHAVGAVVVAIVLGPWAAMLAVSVALLFQALLFGDGGVLSYGVNVLTMAVIMPFVGVWAYRALAGRSALDSRRRTLAAGFGGYVGINAAGLATAVVLGLQPLLFHTADGTALYSPYRLGQTIPAMALAHLTVAGAAEAILTAGVIAYLVRNDVQRLVRTHPGLPSTAVVLAAPRRPRFQPGKAAAGVVAALVLLAPLGLLAPGGAFAEEAPADLDLRALGLRAVPVGLDRLNGFWSHALLADYGFADGQDRVLAYWLSALVGIVVVGAAVYLLGRLAVTVSGRRLDHGDGPGSRR